MVNGLENVLGRSTRISWASGGNVRLPDPPKEILELQKTAERKHPTHSWTGVNFIAGGAKNDVRDYLSEERDASRTLVSTNVDTWVLRHSYKTGEPMHAFLESPPPNDKLKINLTLTPSWHANASGASGFASALKAAPKDEDGFPQIDKAFVKAALDKNASFKKAVEEIGTIDEVAEMVVDNLGEYIDELQGIFTIVEAYDSASPAEQAQIDVGLRQYGVTIAELRETEYKPADAMNLLGEYADSLGTMAMGEKFSKENVYNVEVRLPDGKRLHKTFDVTGKETTSRFVDEDKAYHATTSPDIEVDISKYKGQTIVVTGWPNGSAGVGGYREARETHIHL